MPSAMRWRWPPDSVTPRSPIAVSYPAGSESTNRATCAMPAAHRNDVSLASVPIVMLFAIVSVNRNDSWNTSATLVRSVVAGDLGEVDAADAHHTLVGPVEAREQLAQRRLAAARRADERDHLTGRDANVAVLQHRHAGDVSVLERRRLRRRAGRPAARADAPGMGSGDAASTPSMRSSATTERGISSSRKPTTRIGNASSVNNAIACTSSPGETAPVDTRHPPTASSTMMARFGSASRVGSKSARSAPTRTRATRSWSAAPASRSTSASWRPSVFTTIAPSKLSCVIADTSPTRSCTVCAGSSTRRV